MNTDEHGSDPEFRTTDPETPHKGD